LSLHAPKGLGGNVNGMPVRRRWPAYLLTAVMTALVGVAAISNGQSAPAQDAGPPGHAHPAFVAAAVSGPAPIPATGWTVTADSQETARENGAASNVLDGNTATIWHSAWSTSPAAPLPHWITIDMHTTNVVSGLAYLPRQDGSHNGTIGQYRIDTSTDGTNWGAPVASGTFPDATTAQT